MLGFDAPYLPGWDCHGLPIELKVDRELGPKKREMSTADFRRACRAYAEKYVEIQRRDFKRLGILGLWDDPYKTMAFRYQAAIVRALGKFVAQDMVYKGKKPVHWCTQDRTALAEAEVEYEPHVSPSIYVEFPLSEASRAEAERARAGAGGPAGLGADLDDHALDDPVEPGDRLPPRLRVRRLRRERHGGHRRHGPRGVGGRQDRPRVRHAAGDVPRRGRWSAWCSGIRSTRATRSRVLADYVTLEAGTGAVHTAPGHGADDYHTGVKYGLEIYAPLDAGGHYNDTVELFAGQQVWEANPNVEAALADARTALASRGLRPLVSALLALPQPGDLPGHGAVVHRHGGAGPAGSARSRRSPTRAGSRAGAAPASRA